MHRRKCKTLRHMSSAQCKGSMPTKLLMIAVPLLDAGPLTTGGIATASPPLQCRCSRRPSHLPSPRQQLSHVHRPHHHEEDGCHHASNDAKWNGIEAVHYQSCRSRGLARHDHQGHKRCLQKLERRSGACGIASSCAWSPYMDGARTHPGMCLRSIAATRPECTPGKAVQSKLVEKQNAQ